VTLRTRLALFMSLFVALAVGAQAVLGYIAFERSHTEDLDHDLAQFVALVTEHIEPGSEEFSGVNAAFEGYIAKARITAGGRTIASFGGRFPEEIAPDGLISSSPDSSSSVSSNIVSSLPATPHGVGAWRVTSLPLPGYAPDARLDAAISSRDYTDDLERYRRIAVLDALLFSALGAVAAALLARGALAPLDGLVQATRRVAESGDLTERVSARGRGELPTLATSFNAMLERLGAFRRRESEFTNNASHELRTPLTAMTLSIGAYREGLQSAEETIDDLRSEVAHMRALSESLLLLARDDRARRQPFDLAALVAAVTGGHGGLYAGPVQLEFSGDETLLRRALENLLENAAKYAPAATVRVTLEALNRRIRLLVSDDGLGMSQTLLARATEPFERGASHESGAGLGLSVVERVAVAHGGRMTLENLQPHGFRVTLELPLG
jgi:signal transduction histidine kinase